MARSIRYWLVLGFSALVALAVVAVVSVLLGVLLPRLNAEVERDNAELGVALSAQVRSFLDHSSGEFQRAAAEISAAPQNARVIADTLAGVVGGIEALYLLDALGRIAEVGLPAERRSSRDDLIGLDLSGRAFMPDRNARPVWSEAYLSLRGSIVVALSVPIGRASATPDATALTPVPRSDDAGGAVPASPTLLVGEIDLAALSLRVADLARGAGVMPMVLDRRGHVLAHPDTQRASRQENLAGHELVREGLRGLFATGRVNLDDKEYIGTTVSIGEAGWMVLLARPAELAFATARSTLWAVVLGSVVALLIALSAAYLYGRILTRRVRDFGAHVQAVADGDYLAPLPKSRAEELNNLADSMRRMAAAVIAREAALAESETRFRALFQCAPLPYQSLDMDTNILDVNEAWSALTGYTHEEAIGRPLSDFVEESSFPDLASRFPGFVASGSLEGYAFDIRRKDGGQRTVTISGRVQHDQDGCARTQCILTDISERLRSDSARRAAEEIVRRQALRAAAMLALPRAADQMDEAEFLRHALAVAEDLTESAVSFVHFVDADQENIELVSWSQRTRDSCTLEPDTMHQAVSEAGMWTDALRNKEPVVCNDYATSPARHGLPEGHSRLERLIIVPVAEAGAVRFLLGVGNKAGYYNDFDVETVKLISQDIWRLLSRRRAEDDERLSASVFTASSEGICVTDAEQRIVKVNPALLETTGYAAEELIGQTPKLFKSGRHDDDYYRDMWSHVHRFGVWRGEIWNRRKDGEIFPEWLTITAVMDYAGVVQRYIATYFDISERKQSEEHIRFLAHHDALTKLPNRSLLDDRVRQAVAKSRRNGDHTAVLFLDLDRFKLINDTLGHDVGDRLLEEVARRLTGVLRETETVARLGGDEFVIVIPELADIERVGVVARKVLDVVAEPVDVEGRDLRVTPSIGISVYPEDGEDATTLLRNADTAMYHAKECGRNNFQFFTSAMNVAVQERVAVEYDLRLALEREQFVLFYQPQVDSRSGNVTGMEALIRWQHPTKGLVPPDRFIPIAEETGLIVPIGAWVLREACRQGKAWHDAGRHGLTIGVNLSARQFQQPDLDKQIAVALAESGMSPELLELEITESMLMLDPEAAASMLRTLALLGVQLAIDDFGTGYSSLAYLKRFPVSRLKIDRSFVRDLSTDPNDAAIVRAVVAMADSLKMGVIAEGVETAEQLRFLAQRGCFEVQGYYFSKPKPAGECGSLSYPLPDLLG